MDGAASNLPATSRIRVDLSTLPGVVAHRLGFHPADSLVVAALPSDGARRRVGMMKRVDLDQVRRPADISQIGRSFAGLPVVVILYGGPVHVTEDALRNELGTEVLHVLRQSNGATPVAPDIAAAFALAGRAVLPDRTALRASVEYRPAASSAATRRTIRRFASRNGRDEYLADRLHEAGEAVGELVAAAQAARDEDQGTAHICAALAVLAYRVGDGALARVAAERSLSIDPAGHMARLLLEMIAHAIPPHHLDAVIYGD